MSQKRLRSQSTVCQSGECDDDAIRSLKAEPTALLERVRKLEAVVEASRQARTTLISEPLLHGDAQHRAWLTSCLVRHFAQFDEALEALDALKEDAK